jgi:hypothetical protein
MSPVLAAAVADPTQGLFLREEAVHVIPPAVWMDELKTPRGVDQDRLGVEGYQRRVAIRTL